MVPVYDLVAHACSFVASPNSAPVPRMLLESVDVVVTARWVLSLTIAYERGLSAHFTLRVPLCHCSVERWKVAKRSPAAHALPSRMDANAALAVAAMPRPNRKHKPSQKVSVS
jgi:hypothetical protein